MKLLQFTFAVLLFLCMDCLSSCNSCNRSNNNSSLHFFRYNQSSGIASLDPAFSKDQSTIWACNQLYNSLVQLDDYLNTKPAIARSWQISEDGKTYTFNLRTDVKFHNNQCFKNSEGRIVNAADVVYSLNRIIDKKIASPGAWIFNNSIDTVFPFIAINDSVFQLKLRKAFRPMLGILSMQYCSVIPHEAVEKYGSEFRAHPVGTGPFVFKNWKEGTALILQKNNNYFERDETGNALPYLDGIKISFIDNKKTEYLSFKQKELDFINSIDAAYVDEVLDETGYVKAELKDKFNLLKTPYLNTEYLGFLINDNSQDVNHPLLNKKIRQAINYGFDRSEMLKYLRNGVGKPAVSGFTPFGLPSFNAEQVKGYTFDLQKAKLLLKEAGHEQGKNLPEIKLYTNETYKEYALFISKQLEQIGLKIKVEISQPSILREWMSQGKIDFFRGSWLADYPDAENYFAVFYSKNGSPPNYTRFRNAAFDALYEKALAENVDAKRYELYHEMERIIIEEAPVVPLFYDEVLRFSQKNVEGLTANAINLLNLKKVKLK
ncbi:MAG: ABC transporter substrate-binding protein [Bacteroidetes bacterium]|nr:ABC transporter substrate-binding protein [Bacteroidota bacterium]